jgi:hypothetical protein
VGWLLLFPLILIGAAVVASMTFVRLSTLRITSEGVEFRNYPQAAKLIPLVMVDRFVPPERVGNFSSLRPATVVLLLADGKRLAVRAVGAPDAGRGIEALNRRIATLRDSA